MSSNAENEIKEISSLIGNAQTSAPQPTESTPKKETSEKFKQIKMKIKKYAIISAVVLVLSFILYLIFRKKDVRIFTTPIPFIYSANLKDPFDSFLNAKEKSDILIYYGKDGYGKSRFLSIAEEQLLKNYYFVIHCDFSVLTDESTEKDVITIFKDGIIAAVANSQYPSHLKHSLPLVESLAASLNRTHKQVITDIKDQSLRLIAYHLCSFVDGILQNAPFSSAFINALDALGPAAFIFNEPQKAIKHAPVLCDAIINELFKTSIGSNNVGCICEISDLDFIKKNSDAPHVHFIEVGPFSLEDARTYLKGTFKARQITELYNNYGGRGKYYAKVYEQIRDGKVSFAKSIENVKINDI